jgi:hypothetical protein
MRREGCTDSISLRVLGWNAPPWHAATDGAGCTAELGYGAPAPHGSAYEQARMQPGFACLRKELLMKAVCTILAASPVLGVHSLCFA